MLHFSIDVESYGIAYNLYKRYDKKEFIDKLLFTFELEISNWRSKASPMGTPNEKQLSFADLFKSLDQDDDAYKGVFNQVVTSQMFSHLKLRIIEVLNKVLGKLAPQRRNRQSEDQAEGWRNTHDPWNQTKTDLQEEPKSKRENSKPRTESSGIQDTQNRQKQDRERQACR